MKPNKLKKFVLTFIVLDSLAMICLFIFYGPFGFVREFLILNAMPTFDHKYIARTFYCDDIIYKILENNKVIESDDSTDTNKVNVQEIKNKDTYESIYEEQVLKRENEQDLYKIFTVEENTYRAYIAVIYDPKRILLVAAKDVRKDRIADLVNDNNAQLGINASGYRMGTRLNGVQARMVNGPEIIDGKLVSNKGDSGWGGGIVGFDNNGILILSKDDPETNIKNGLKYGMQFGPFLIVNGKMAEFKGTSGDRAPRSAIAQRKDGVILLLASDARGTRGIDGMTLQETATLLARYGAYNASNLDGGNSSVMYANNKFINNPSTQYGEGGRILPNAWIVK